MTSAWAGSLPALRRHNLMSEFAGLKQACPEGVFVSLTPGDSTLWSAVLFVRDGPYSPAVLRFQILFPDSYPQLPPLVTFSTDLFHPLITPLTTYMYTTDIQDNGTVSASDDERLPPGGFSLRHGFPHWFGRGKKSSSGSRNTSNQHDGTPTPAAPGQTRAHDSPESSTREPALPKVPEYMQLNKRNISAYEILAYIRSTFDTDEVLDDVPLEAAGNPGAWHAWRTHRRKLGELNEGEDGGQAEPRPEQDKEDSTPEDNTGQTPKKPQPQVNKPGQWNWDGVWENRVKKGISASLTEPVLYGGANISDDLIHFLALDDSEVDSIKENIRRTLGSPA